MKKFGAVILALILVLSVSSAALATGAADMSGKGGIIGKFTEPDTATVQGTSVIIYKEITAYNPETIEVNAPAITFNYTIGAGDADKNIYDASSHHDPAANAHALTKAGVGTPTITGTDAGTLALVPGTDTLNASKNGTANRFELTVNFDGIFKTETTAKYAAGVYRYVIEETTTETTKNAAGIKEGTGANTLYMDVYVNGYGDIYGYVLFTENADIDARPDNDADAATSAGKIEGFVGSAADGEPYESEDASVADKYYTFNLSVKKVVENDNYTVTTKHQFPFSITLANSAVTANVLPIMTINDSNLATQTALVAGPIAGTWTPTIASGGVITYIGIPTGTTVTINETNNVKGVIYKSVSTNADTNAESKDIDYNETSNNAIVNCGATALAVATENHTAGGKGIVTFTNTLMQISPTGLTLRIAPYALMLAGGIVLLLISRRKAKAEE